MRSSSAPVRCVLLAIAIFCALCMPASPVLADAGELLRQDETPATPVEPSDASDAPGDVDTPDEATASWLEPQGVNVLDLVGLVPDSHLQGSVVSYETGSGVLVYDSGRRSGDTVTVTVSVIPRHFSYGNETFTKFNCLSQHAAWDQWPSTVPATVMTVTANGRDVTSSVFGYALTAAGQTLPAGNTSAYLRYPKPDGYTEIGSAAQVTIPANKGCSIFMTGRQTNIKATFRATIPQQINVTPLYSETFDVHSYIGPGNMGVLKSLNEQMQDRYGNRHDKFDMHIPDGADYVVVNFPPMPLDPFAAEQAENAGLAGSGTYRFEGGGTLSVDHVNLMGLPLLGQWKNSGGSGAYLDYIAPLQRFGSPEYVLPPGIAYNACMSNGGCSDALLSGLYNQTYKVTLHYYRIDRVAGSTLQRIPLRAVGNAWQGSAVAASVAIESPAQTSSRTFLPTIAGAGASEPEPAPSDDATGCPCGWFDAQGRMFDFIPKP